MRLADLKRGIYLFVRGSEAEGSWCPMNKLTADEALRLGLLKFRELHAEGSIPPAVAERFTFNIRPSAGEHTLQICLWESEERQPLIYFEAMIDRETRSVRVTKDEGLEEMPGRL